MVAWNDDSEFGNAMKSKSRDDAAKQACHEMRIAHDLCRIYLMGRFSVVEMTDEARQAIDKLVQQSWHIWVPTARTIIESLVSPDR